MIRDGSGSTGMHLSLIFTPFNYSDLLLYDQFSFCEYVICMSGFLVTLDDFFLDLYSFIHSFTS